MWLSIQRTFMHLFTSLCTLATLFMAVYWCYKFSLNIDTSVVTYREFNEGKDKIRPTISMCLRNPFEQEHLAEYGVNQSTYLDFLKGKYFSKEMLTVDFNHVTIDISDYIKGYRIYFRNGSMANFGTDLSIETKKTLTHTSFSGFAGFYNVFIICYALNIPKIDNLEGFRILLSNNIFPNGIRPAFLGFKTFVHLPRQFLLSAGTERWIWPPRKVDESYKLQVFITGVTIETKRDKKDDPCSKHWKDYDELVFLLHKKEAKCNIPYHTQSEEWPICSNQSMMKHALFSNRRGNWTKYEKPCKTMEDVRIKHLESNMEKAEGQRVGEFWFEILFPFSKLKHIEQAR